MKYIMIIDDSVTIRAIAELVLKNLGYGIKHAINGEDALNKIKEIKSNGDEIVLCITDVNMPVMDGIEFFYEIKKSEKFMPVIMLTSESEEKQFNRNEHTGVSCWINKPFDPKELLDVVTGLINA